MKYLSLTVGRRLKLKADFPATWTCDNSLIEILGDGWIIAKANSDFYKNPSSVANLVATSKANGTIKEYFRVTIVPWSAERLKLEEVKRFTDAYIIKKHVSTDKVYVSTLTGTELFVTTDNLETFTKLGNLPEPQTCPMLITPLGYFMHGIRTIYKSADLVTWTPCFVKGIGTSVTMKNFDFKYDAVNDKVLIFTGEYQGDANYRSKVYRGTISRNGTELWETIYEFKSRNEGIANPLITDACYHVHTVKADAQTGAVWICTGDNNNENRMMRSMDNGNTWLVVGDGSQEWRTLDFWSDQGHFYWGMDSGYMDKIFRIPYSWIGTQTKAYINANKTVVADLDGGSMWYTMRVKDNKGDMVTLLCCANEGKRKDHNARSYIIKTKTDLSYEVDEVLNTPSATPDLSIPYVQMRPFYQDDDGYIYLTGRETNPLVTYKYKLVDYGINRIHKFTPADKYFWL